MSGMGDGNWGWESIGDWEYKPNPKWCTHDWLDTGMRLIFCKKCNVPARLDPMTGEIEIKYPEEKKIEETSNIVKGEG